MPIETDALIIGAGPVGLFQAFQLGLQDVRTHIVDALPYAGGQCIELYADKPIYDIPGIPLCTGRELISQLQKQVAPFAPQFHFNSIVNALSPQSDGRYLVSVASVDKSHPCNDTHFLTKSVFIAAGVGAFQPRTLKLEGAAALEGKQLHYRLDEHLQGAGKHICILGDGDAALQAALALSARNANLQPSQKLHVSVLHRRDAFSAQPLLVARFREAVESGALHFVAGQISALKSAGQSEGETLSSLEVLQADGATRALPCDQLLVLQGLSPKLGPIADWGLAMERRQLQVDTETFSTTQAGIFAVGDINTYPGKKKLIVCGFHECVMAAFGAMPRIRPEEKVLLQYTTTSSKLHKLLGVEHPGAV